VTYKLGFKITIIQHQITRKWYNIELCLQYPTDRKSYMIYRTAPFSMTLNDLYPRFQCHAGSLTLNILEMVRDVCRHCFSGTGIL